MNAFILFLHLFGLMLGSAGGLGSGVIMRRALTMPPEQAMTVRSLGPLLANVAAIGLVLLWVTGVIMVWSRWDGLGSLPGLFWVKFVFVVTLTLASGAVHMTYAEIRRTGNVALGARLAKLGPAAGLSAILAVLFAVFAFN
jgi:hypothetical protein